MIFIAARLIVIIESLEKFLVVSFASSKTLNKNFRVIKLNYFLKKKTVVAVELAVK